MGERRTWTKYEDDFILSNQDNMSLTDIGKSLTRSISSIVNRKFRLLTGVGTQPVKVGDTFGYLTVVDRVKEQKNNRTYYLCKCLCGTQKEIMGNNLNRGLTRSCGCKTKTWTSVV